MAENKHIKKLKINGLKPSTFASNVKESVKYTVEDVSRDLVPYAYNLADANSQISDAFSKAIESLSPKAIKSAIKNTPHFEALTTGAKNAKSDLKKGIFNNRKRSEDAMFGDLGFDFGDFDDNLSLDDMDFSSDNNEFNNTNNVTNIFAGNMNEDNLSSTIRQSASSQIQFSSEQHSQQMTVSSSINDNLAKLVAFQTESTQKHYEETAQFYANATQLQKEIKELLLPKQAEETVTKESDFEKVMGSSGGINFAEYTKTILKKNIPDLLDEVTMGMFSMSKSMMDKDMMQQSLDEFKNNPLGVITSSLIKNAIPRDFKDTLEDFNKSLSNSAKTFAMKMNSIAKQDTFEFMDELNGQSEGKGKQGFRFLLGKLLKLDTEEQITRLSTDKYEKGKVDFDGITRKSIVEVIPMYLRKILSSLQGTKDEIIYDYNDGQAMWMSEKQRKFDAEKLMREMSGFFDAKDKVSSYLINDMKVKDIYEVDNRQGKEKNFQKDLDTVLSTLKELTLPRMDNEMEIDFFKRNVLDKRDLSGNQLISDESAISPIIAAIHSALSPKQKLELAGNGLDSLEMQNMFMKNQQENITSTGMGQILSTKNLSLKDSSDYINANNKDDNERVIHLENQDKVNGFLSSSSNHIKDIYQLLLEGIVVYPKDKFYSNNDNDDNIESSRWTKAKKLNEDVENRKEINDRFNNERELHKNREYDRQNAQNLEKNKFGLGVNEMSDLAINDNTMDLAYQMWQTKKEQDEEEKRNKKFELGKKENFLQKMFKTPFKKAEDGLKTIIDNMAVAFYGTAEDRNSLFNTEDGEKLPFNKAIVKGIYKISGKFDKLFDSLKGQFDKFKNFLFGDKGENGKFEGGILSPLKNLYTDGFRRTSNLFTGNEQTLTDGSKVDARENSLKSMFKLEFDRIKLSLFGNKDDDSKKGLFASFKEKASSTLEDMQEFIFGKGNKKSSEELASKFKEYAPNAIFGGSLGLIGGLFLPGGPLIGSLLGSLASMGAKSGHLETMLFGSNETGQDIFGKKFKGLFEYDLVKKGMNKIEGNLSMVKGGGLGVLAGMFLPGGPLLGGAIGSLLGLNEKTKFLDNFLFGKVDKDGKVLEEGLFKSKYLQGKDTKEIKKDALLGGGLGVLGGLFLPGGPLLGVTLGTMLGFNKKTGFLQDFLFGKEGSDSRNYIQGLTKKAKETFSKYGMKGLQLGSFGLLGSMFLPGGPIISSLLGMTIGSKLSNADFRQNIHKFIFGNFDPETGEGRLGQLPQLMNAVSANIVLPMKNMVRNVVEDSRHFLNKHVFIPLKFAFKPFTDLGKHMLTKGKDLFKEIIVTPIVDTMNLVLKPLREMGSKVAKALLFLPKLLLKGLIKLPVKLFTGLSDKVANYNAKHGIGDGYLEHEQKRSQALRDEDTRSRNRKTDIDNIKTVEDRKAQAIFELSRLQRQDAKDEKSSNKLKETAANTFTKAQQDELDILKAEKDKNNKQLGLTKRLFMSREEKAQARDNASQANSKYNNTLANYRQENLDNYTDESNGESQFSKDKKNLVEDIGLEKLTQLRIIKSDGAEDYETAKANVIKIQNQEKIEEKNSENTQTTAENTGLIVESAKTIIDILRGTSGKSKDTIEDDDTNSLQTNVIPVKFGKKTESNEEIDEKVNEEKKIPFKLDLTKKSPLGNNEKVTSANSNTAVGSIVDKVTNGKDFNEINQEKEQRKEKGKTQELYEGFKGLFKNTETSTNSIVGSAKRGIKLGKMLLLALPVIMKVMKVIKDFVNGGFVGVLTNSVKPGGFLNKMANTVVSNLISGFGGLLGGKGASTLVKSTVGKVFGKSGKGLLNSATNSLVKQGASIASNVAKKFGKDSLAKNIAEKGTDGFAQGFVKKQLGKFLNLKPVQSVLGSSGVKAVAKASGSLFKKAGGKVLAKAGAAAAAAPVTAAFIAGDLMSGFSNPRKVFKIGKDQKVTMGMRTASAVGKAISNNVLFGLVPDSTVSEIIYKAVAGEESGSKLDEMQNEFKEQADKAGVSVNEFNSEVNKGFISRAFDTVKNSFKNAGNFLFGSTELDEDGNKVQTQKGILNPFSWFRKTKDKKEESQRQNTISGSGRGFIKPNVGQGEQQVQAVQKPMSQSTFSNAKSMAQQSSVGNNANTQATLNLQSKVSNSLSKHDLQDKDTREQKVLENLSYIAKASVAVAASLYSKSGDTLYNVVRSSATTMAAIKDLTADGKEIKIENQELPESTQLFQQQLNLMQEQTTAIQEMATATVDIVSNQTSSDGVPVEGKEENKFASMFKSAIGGIAGIAGKGIGIMAQSVITASVANPAIGALIAGGGSLALADFYARGFDSILGKTIKKVLMMPVNLFKKMAVGLDKAILGDKNITDNIVRPMITYARNNYGLFMNKQEKIAWKKLKDTEQLQKVTLKDVFSKNHVQGDLDEKLLKENKLLWFNKKRYRHIKTSDKEKSIDLPETEKTKKGFKLPKFFSKKDKEAEQSVANNNIPIDYYKKKALMQSEIAANTPVVVEKTKEQLELEELRQKTAHLIKAQNDTIAKNQQEFASIGKNANELSDNLNDASETLLDLNKKVDEASDNIETSSDKNSIFSKFKDSTSKVTDSIKGNKYVQKVTGNKHVQKASDIAKSGLNKVMNNPVSNFMAEKSQSALSAVPGLLSKIPVIGPAISSIPGLSTLLASPAAGTILAAVAPVLPIVAGGAAIFGLHKFGPQIEQFVEDLPDKIVDFIQKSVVFIFKDLPKIVISAGKTLLKLIVKIPMVIPKVIMGLAKNMFSGIKDFGSKIFTSIKTSIGNAFSYFTEPFVKFGKAVGHLFTDPIGFFKELIFGKKTDEEIAEGEVAKQSTSVITEHVNQQKEEPRVQNTISVNTAQTSAPAAVPVQQPQSQAMIGTGRGNIFSPIKKQLMMAGTVASTLTSAFAPSMDTVHANNVIEKSMSNPVIASVANALQPIYGDAAPLVAPGLVGLTLQANDKVISLLQNVKSINATDSLENNVTMQQIKRDEEREAKKSGIFNTVGNIFNNITDGASNIVGNIVEGITTGFNGIKEFFFGNDEEKTTTDETPTGSGRGKILSGRGFKQNVRRYNGKGTNNGYTYFNQNDTKWANQSLSNGDGDTVGSAGCGPTAVAMALSSRGVNTDPAQASNFAQSYKVKNEGVSADFISDYGSSMGVNLTGRTIDKYSNNDVDMSLASGQPVVALGKSNSGSTPYTSAGHYVTISGKDEQGNYKVSDPLDSNNNNKSYSASDLFNNTQAYWTDSSIDGSMLGDTSGLMGFGSNFGKPVSGSPTVTSRYGNRVIQGENNFHTGIDYGLASGNDVYAVADGEVYRTDDVPYTGKSYGYGTHIRLKHNDQNRSLYAHLSKLLVNNGDKVKKGQLIGKSGNTGWSTGPHLHFELRDSSDKTYDPYPYVINGVEAPSGQTVATTNEGAGNNATVTSDTSNTTAKKFDISSILGTVSSLFKGFITGNFDDLKGESSDDSSSSSSGTSTTTNSSTSGINTISVPSQSERSKNYKGGTVDFSMYGSKQQNFFNNIQKDALQNYIDFGVLPSLTLAQAVHESGWGTSGLATQGNALFGIKPGSAWNGKVYTGKTTEYYDGKNPTHITDSFRAYNNWGESIEDHGKFLNKDRYQNVLKAKDSKSATKAIYQAGYATDPNYTTLLDNTISSYKLERADSLVGRGGSNKRSNKILSSTSLGKGTSLLKKAQAKTKTIFEGKGYENFATKVEKASTTISDYMGNTSDKINKSLDTSYIIEHMAITLDKVADLLTDIKDSALQTANNTREIADKEFSNVSLTENTVDGNKSVEVNDNSVNASLSKGNGKNFFTGNSNSNTSDPYANLKNKVMQIAQG